MNPKRLITVVRRDISPGYQIAQTAHAVAEYILLFPKLAMDWHINGNYMISLSVQDENELLDLQLAVWHKGVEQRIFFEDDIKQYTSLVFVETEDTLELTKKLPLAGRKINVATKYK